MRGSWRRWCRRGFRRMCSGLTLPASRLLLRHLVSRRKRCWGWQRCFWERCSFFGSSCCTSLGWPVRFVTAMRSPVCLSRWRCADCLLFWQVLMGEVWKGGVHSIYESTTIYLIFGCGGACNWHGIDGVGGTFWACGEASDDEAWVPERADER